MSKLTGICGYDGKTYTVAPHCGVVTSNMQRPKDEWQFCRKPTTHFYPSMGGGTMPLCAEHAQKHLPHGAWPVGVPPLSERRPNHLNNSTEGEST